MDYNYADLFSGIGGFALGAEWAGWNWKNHFYSEIDEYAIKIYQKRFPNAIPLGDIKGVDIFGLKQQYGENWIIAGGFPCQDISVANTKGTGIKGSRSGLWYQMWEFISILRPRYVIIENVSVITIRGLDRVLSSLAKIGYDAEWQNIRASDVGAPHKRERIWIIAYPHGSGDRTPTNGIERQGQKKSGQGVDRPFFEPRRYGENVSDARQFQKGNEEKPERPQNQFAGCSSGEYGEKDNRSGEPVSETEPKTNTGGYWLVEPDVDRLANGIPCRVDRLKCLGNAIVPQIAEILFRRIKDTLWQHQEQIGQEQRNTNVRG